MRLWSHYAGPWKYNRCKLDPDQLYNLDEDPNELTNLALKILPIKKHYKHSKRWPMNAGIWTPMMQLCAKAKRADGLSTHSAMAPITHGIISPYKKPLTAICATIWT